MSLQVIPPMTHELSKGWGQQPNPKNVLIDEKYALMSRADFDLLRDYTASQPTGVYEGKMWKIQARRTKDDPYIWFLRWFDVCSDPNKCAVKTREIIIL